MNTILSKSILTYSLLTFFGVISTSISAVLGLPLWATLTAGLVTLAFFWLQFSAIKKNLNRWNYLAEEVSEGKWPDISQNTKDPMLKNLRKLHKKLEEVVSFSAAEDKENYRLNYLEEDDNIAQALLQLSEKQKKHEETERKRLWKIDGVRKFSEIIRKNNEELDVLCHKVLSNLVKYINANQGSIFIEEKNEENEPIMKMAACYAYDRKKFIDKEVKEGQGLLGQVMLEQDLIYMTEVPEDFVNITSGLGESTPRNILIMPLMANDEFYGAIELASFHLFNETEMEFLKEVSKNIASAVSGVKTKQNTERLLEESQTMATELQSAEEEMRQNMEELQATQEEMERKQTELNGLFGAIDTSQIMVEFDLDGNLLNANDKILELLGCNMNDFKKVASQFHNHNGVLEKVKGGAHENKDIHIVAGKDRQLWLNANFSPVKDNNGQVSKMLVLSQNISEKKKREKQMQMLSLVSDNTDNAVIITDSAGHIEYVNNGFTELTGYQLEEVREVKPIELLQGKDTQEQTISKVEEKIELEEPLNTEIFNYKKDGTGYWAALTLNPVKNDKDEVEKYIFVQADITDTKMKSLDYEHKMEAISKSNVVLELDMKGSILTTNQNFVKVFKYREEEVQGDPLTMLLNEKDKKEHEAIWEQLRKGESVSGEFKMTNRMEQPIWLRGVYNPILNLNGEPIKVIWYATDVTQEKELQITSDKQQRELTSHLETLNKTIATIEFDSKAKIKSVNQVFLDISGYNKKELKGKDYEFLLPEDEISKPQHKMMWDSILSGNFFTGQFRQMSKEGEDLWLLGTFNPVNDENGKLSGIKMFAQFNTLEREKQIKTDQMLEAFNKTLPTLELDHAGYCKRGNKILKEQFGIGRKEMRKKTIDEVLGEEFTEKQRIEMIEMLETGDSYEAAVSIKADDDEKVLRVIFNPIQKGGQLDQILVMLIDKQTLININTDERYI